MPQMERKRVKLFDTKKFLILLIILLAALLVDTSVVKINDLIDKYFIPLKSKLFLFSTNSSLCLALQFFIIKYVTGSSKRDRLNRVLRVEIFYYFSLASLAVSTALIGFSIYQQIFYHYYDTLISTFIIIVSYGTSGVFISWLAFLFYSWYRSSRNVIVILYFISMAVIVFNLIMTASLASVKVNARPSHAVEYVGSSGDISGAKFQLLNEITRISSFLSFFSIWLTTAILISAYRNKLLSSIAYWIILSVPLVYFIVSYFYQFIFGRILTSYLESDPVIVSLILGTFLSLIKPVGGFTFGIAFWNISKIIRYERNIRIAMIIAGWGMLLIFSANQATTQVVGPYPPFGLATITVLNLGGYMMLLGIYNSATLVSVNNDLRKFIHKRALESKLLGLIGQAEMETEIQKTVKKIAEDKDKLSTTPDQQVELDEMELKKYVDVVIKEIKKEHQS